MSKQKIGKFINFFGGKFRNSLKYPAPMYDTIIEPFAGSAGYSNRYFDRNVVLYDTNHRIFSVWDWLIKATPEDVMRLPLLARADQKVDELDCGPAEKNLIGYWVNIATGPRKTLRLYARKRWPDGYGSDFWGAARREILARDVGKIKHWKIFNESWENARADKPATYFIDPPYRKLAREYKKSKVDYEALARWCLSLRGQVIVCEILGADWLPFKVGYKQHGCNAYQKNDPWSTECFCYILDGKIQ